MSLPTREAHRKYFVLSGSRLTDAGIVMMQKATKGTVPQTKVVVIITLLEPHDPVRVAAIPAGFRVLFEESTEHL